MQSMQAYQAHMTEKMQGLQAVEARRHEMMQSITQQLQSMQMEMCDKNFQEAHCDHMHDEMLRILVLLARK